MSEHYYSKNPKVKSDPKEWQATVRDKRLRFQDGRRCIQQRGSGFRFAIVGGTFILPNAEGDVLDVGCGYGPIGLSIAASFPDRNIHMVDVNERALALASENAKLNGISNVSIYPSDAIIGSGSGRLRRNIDESANPGRKRNGIQNL